MGDKNIILFGEGSDDFEMQMNAILRLNEISLKLDNGRIVSMALYTIKRAI